MENEALTTQPEPSLRDTIIESTIEVTKESAPAPVSADTKPEEGQTEPPVADTPEQKLGRTANRLRDEQGRLLPGKKEPEQKAAPLDQSASSPAPAVAAPRPSTWKKDHWEAWDKLAAENPKLAAYLNQREGEYAKGVSTYKAEVDRLKPLDNVIAPYRDVMRQHKVQEVDVIKNLLNAHHRLTFGSQDDRLGMVEKLIDDYRMPVKLAYQDQQGNWQLLGPRPQQPQQPNIDAIVEQKLAEREVLTALQQFERDVPEKYPHYEAVKQTMIGLLQAGLAQDYPSAYEKAIRHHDDLWQQEQAQQAEAKAQADAAARQAQVQRARANNVSVRTAAPGGGTPANGNNLRDTLTENYRQFMGGGRV